MKKLYGYFIYLANNSLFYSIKIDRDLKLQLYITKKNFITFSMVSSIEL